MKRQEMNQRAEDIIREEKITKKSYQQELYWIMRLKF